MKTILLAAIIVLCVCQVFAQTNPDLQAKDGKDINIGPYRFTDFIEGIVHYKNGNRTTAKLNFNILIQEMHFISPQGDTLAIANPLHVSSIVMDSSLYYYCKEGYLEVFSGYDSIYLAAKFRLSYEKEKIGGYGLANPTASIDVYRSFIDRNSVYSLSSREQVTFFKDATIYFINNKRQAFRASKANLIKLFPNKKESIEKYLARNQVNFNSRTDVGQLLFHITGLYREL